MAVYAQSGTVLIFRDTDFLKQEKTIEKQLETNISASELGDKLRMKRFKATREEGDIILFDEGSYNETSGMASYKTKALPILLDKMTKLHKATTDSPLFWLNIFFGISLLFFVISTFWMFAPKSSKFKKGLYFSLAGIVLTFLMLFV
jgi:hypothetical protein